MEEEFFSQGTLSAAARTTLNAILIPDVLEGEGGWHAVVRTNTGALVWADAEIQGAEAAWECAVLGIKQLCAEKKRLVAADAVEQYIAALLRWKHHEQPSHAAEARSRVELERQLQDAHVRMLTRLDRLSDLDLERVLAAHPLHEEGSAPIAVTTIAQVRNADLWAL